LTVKGSLIFDQDLQVGDSLQNQTVVSDRDLFCFSIAESIQIDGMTIELRRGAHSCRPPA
jgi:hypothetical protein